MGMSCRRERRGWRGHEVNVRATVRGLKLIRIIVTKRNRSRSYHFLKDPFTLSRETSVKLSAEIVLDPKVRADAKNYYALPLESPHVEMCVSST